MKDRFNIIVAAALLMVLMLAAAFLHNSHLAMLASGLAFMAGTVVVNYKYPVAGTVEPTAAVMRVHNEVNAQVTALDTDTVIAVIHNWGLASKGPTGFPDGPPGLFPVVIIDIDGSATTTVQPVFLVTLSNTNQVTINKPTTVGTQGTFNVVILRPTTLIRLHPEGDKDAA